VNLADFDYDLPQRFIAQTPIEPRDASRLMVLNRADGSLTHAQFRGLGQFLRRGDVLIFNDTRVIPARMYAKKAETGGRVELLLLKRRAPLTWEAIVGGKGLHIGTMLDVEGQAGLQAVVMQAYDGPRRLLQFSKPITPLLPRVGHVPLPPYIHEPLADGNRYQTVYAQNDGSAAAPTAGLHFTPDLLAQLQAAGVCLGWVTLHIGLDTFSPVAVARVEEHRMHGEWCQVTDETAELVNAAKREGRRVIAVGTSSVRTLESAQQGAHGEQWIAPTEGATDLYIFPGYRFRVVDAIITNFHLPRSTLLMLVSAFAGRERILAAYEAAKREGYRFYSFGDAMLIL
jgi:S-adenosylmethionine:tRNA ribosyltransferase-isomerase